MNTFIPLVAIITAPVLLAVASLLWGTDSREGPDSSDWVRRRRTADTALNHERR